MLNWDLAQKRTEVAKKLCTVFPVPKEGAVGGRQLQKPIEWCNFKPEVWTSRTRETSFKLKDTIVIVTALVVMVWQQICSPFPCRCIVVYPKQH